MHEHELKELIKIISSMNALLKGGAMEKIMKVKKITESDDTTVVNNLLEEGWILIGINSKENKIKYSLGFIPKEQIRSQM